MKATRLAFASPSRRPFHRGFTLTELLVVITILIVLAALILSVTNRMKTSAKKTKEMANMKNIANLVLIYHSDQGVLPGKPSSGAVGGLNRGVVVPSRSNVAAENSLSTYLISKGLVGGMETYKTGVDDDLWHTSVSLADKSNMVSMLINSGVNSDPPNFFGRKQGTDKDPANLASLKRNKKNTSLPNQDLGQLWMLCSADELNYGQSASVSTGVKGSSEWQGRFYAFFDGHVDLIKQQTPSIYPEDKD